MIGWLFALWTGVAAAQPPALDDVLASVEVHFPLLVAAEAERIAAEGALMSAQGGFDPQATAQGWWKTGPYDQGYVEGRVSQATPLYGLQLGAGWRYGEGSFATYDGWYDTKDGGEVFVDATLPLLKGGFTDDRRTDIAVARASRDAALAKVEAKRIEVAHKARLVWWKWVGAGATLAIAERMRDVAATTLQATQRRIDAGDLAPISLIDAQRVRVEREVDVLAAQRTLDAAAYLLGLYLRDGSGTPSDLVGVLPPELPTPPALTVEPVDTSLTLALGRHPDLVGLQAKQRSIAAKQKLARLAVLPKLDLKVELRQDLTSDAEAAEPFDAKVGGVFDVSFLQRAARGKRRTADAEAAAVDAALGYARDELAAEVRTAHTTVVAAHRQAVLADELALLARQLEDATRQRFSLGDADLFAVYLREQSAMKAAQSRVYAWVAYHSAQADLLAATGGR